MKISLILVKINGYINDATILLLPGLSDPGSLPLPLLGLILPPLLGCLPPPPALRDVPPPGGRPPLPVYPEVEGTGVTQRQAGGVSPPEGGLAGAAVEAGGGRRHGVQRGFPTFGFSCCWLLHHGGFAYVGVLVGEEGRGRQGDVGRQGGKASRLPPLIGCAQVEGERGCWRVWEEGRQSVVEGRTGNRGVGWTGTGGVGQAGTVGLVGKIGTVGGGCRVGTV